MTKNYYKGTICKLEAIDGKIVHDRIVCENAILYQSLVTPYCYVVTDNLVNTKELAYDLVFSQDQKYTMATYLDEESLVPISFVEAASSILAEGFLGEVITEPLSETDAVNVLKKTIR